MVVVGAAAIMMATASAFTGTTDFGHFRDALGLAQGTAAHISPAVGAIFALLLFDASIVGASAVTLATSYAFGDMFGLRHSLHRGIGDAKLFYGTYAAMVALAAAIVLIPRAPLGLITTAVQALAGILLPSSTVFVGPAVQRPRGARAVGQPAVAERRRRRHRRRAARPFDGARDLRPSFPTVDVSRLVVVLGARDARSCWSRRARGSGSASAAPLATPEMSRAERENWRMPALALLERPRVVAAAQGGDGRAGGYLVLAVILLAVKASQLALRHDALRTVNNSFTKLKRRRARMLARALGIDRAAAPVLREGA